MSNCKLLIILKVFLYTKSKTRLGRVNGWVNGWVNNEGSTRTCELDWEIGYVWTVGTSGDTFLALWFLIFGSAGSVKHKEREIILFSKKGNSILFLLSDKFIGLIIKRIVQRPYHLKKKCSVGLTVRLLLRPSLLTFWWKSIFSLEEKSFQLNSEQIWYLDETMYFSCQNPTTGMPMTGAKFKTWTFMTTMLKLPKQGSVTIGGDIHT